MTVVDEVLFFIIQHGKTQGGKEYKVGEIRFPYILL